MKRIFLIGFMGCGKSSFGRRLAARLGWDFVDTDAEIERRAGMTVAQIFATLGEPAFRELEAEVLAEVIEGRAGVIALGGGTPCREGVMERLNGCGTTIYLRMPPSRLVRRLGVRGRAKRPKIAGMSDAELREFIEKNLPEREMWYKKANFVVNLAGIPDCRVVELLKKYT